MSRPNQMGIVFVDDLDFAVVEVLAWQDAFILTLCSVLPL